MTRVVPRESVDSSKSVEVIPGKDKVAGGGFAAAITIGLIALLDQIAPGEINDELKSGIAALVGFFVLYLIPEKYEVTPDR